MGSSAAKTQAEIINDILLSLTEEDVIEIIEQHIKSLLETTAGEEVSATRWTLSVMFNGVLRSLPIICMLLLFFSPLILARRSSTTRKSLKAWAWKMFKLNWLIVAILAVISLTIATFNWLDPSYAAGKQVLYHQVTECADRFKDLACDSQPILSSERECFALGMCLVQPLWTQIAQIFLSNWWEVNVTLIISYLWILEIFLLAKIWVSRLLSKTPWRLDLDYFVTGDEQEAPVQAALINHPLEETGQDEIPGPDAPSDPGSLGVGI